VSAPATTNTAPHDSARGARLPPNSAPSLLVVRGILRMPTPVRDMDACVASGVPRRGQPHQRTRLALVKPCDEGNPRRLPAYRTSRYSWRITPVPQTGPLLLSCVLLPPRDTAQSVSGRIQAAPQVSPEILHVLQSRRQTQHSVCNTGRQPHCGINAAM